jgi:hypothetical protein
MIKVFRTGAKFTWEMQAPNGVMICRAIKTFKTAGLCRESIQNWLDIIRERPVYIVEESIPQYMLMGKPTKTS